MNEEKNLGNFRFNKIYVIESLSSKDTKTGKELYDDLLRYKEFEIDKLTVDYKEINSKKEFIEFLKGIAKDCRLNSVYPIIHLEIHGDSQQRGLVLNSNELITWHELYDLLSSINFAVRNNLFLTLTVCYGLYLMQIAEISRPAPFWGFIGSYDEITTNDLSVRYNEFYSAFLTDFKISKALEALHASNPEIPSTFRLIASEELFCNVYSDYRKEQFSNEAIDKRVENSSRNGKIKLNSRTERRKFRREFEKTLYKTRFKYYEQHRKLFFMINSYPENEERFKVNIKI